MLAIFPMLYNISLQLILYLMVCVSVPHLFCPCSLPSPTVTTSLFPMSVCFFFVISTNLLSFSDSTYK